MPEILAETRRSLCSDRDCLHKPGPSVVVNNHRQIRLRHPNAAKLHRQRSGHGGKDVENGFFAMVSLDVDEDSDRISVRNAVWSSGRRRMSLWGSSTVTDQMAASAPRILVRRSSVTVALMPSFELQGGHIPTSVPIR